MNNRFLSILVAKIDVWISISIFLAAKMSTVYRPNWKSVTTKSCASPQSSTLDSSHRCLMRTTSGACDGEDCWSRRPCTCSDAIYIRRRQTSSTPAIRGAGDLHQTVCHYQYQRTTARHVSDRRTSANMNSLYMAYWSGSGSGSG